MTKQAIRAKHLKLHGIECKLQDGKLFVVDSYTILIKGKSYLRCAWVDLTDVNLRNWLNY